MRGFISKDSALSFEKKMVMLKALSDVEFEVERSPSQMLETTLLKLRYKGKQTIPSEWLKTIMVPSERAINECGEKSAFKDNVKSFEEERKKIRGEKVVML